MSVGRLLPPCRGVPSYGGQAFTAAYDAETQKKYVDHVVFTALVEKGRAGRDYEAEARDAFLEKL